MRITALRGDQVNPVGLGRSRFSSEGSVRLAFKRLDPEACAQRQLKALAQTGNQWSTIRGYSTSI